MTDIRNKEYSIDCTDTFIAPEYFADFKCVKADFLHEMTDIMAKCFYLGMGMTQIPFGAILDLVQGDRTHRIEGERFIISSRIQEEE